MLLIGFKYGAGHPLVVPIGSVFKIGQPSLKFLPEPT